MLLAKPPPIPAPKPPVRGFRWKGGVNLLAGMLSGLPRLTRNLEENLPLKAAIGFEIHAGGGGICRGVGEVKLGWLVEQSGYGTGFTNLVASIWSALNFPAIKSSQPEPRAIGTKNQWAEIIIVATGRERAFQYQPLPKLRGFPKRKLDGIFFAYHGGIASTDPAPVLAFAFRPRSFSATAPAPLCLL